MPSLWSARPSGRDDRCAVLSWVPRPDYAEYALLLQLLLLSAIPQVVVGVAASVARVQRHLLVLAAQQTALSVLVFALAEIGLRSVGLVGVGLAWLASQTIVAVLVLATSLRMVWVGIIPVSLLTWADGVRRGFATATPGCPGEFGDDRARGRGGLR